jgi:plastocyanin
MPSRFSFDPLRAALLAAAAVAVALPASAADPEVQLAIREHRFEPAELKVPAGQRVRLVLQNQDATPEEFESHTLNREKVVPAKGKVTIFIGPLKRGRYAFVGEYHEATAKGVVIAE